MDGAQIVLLRKQGDPALRISSKTVFRMTVSCLSSFLSFVLAVGWFSAGPHPTELSLLTSRAQAQAGLTPAFALRRVLPPGLRDALLPVPSHVRRAPTEDLALGTLPTASRVIYGHADSRWLRLMEDGEQIPTDLLWPVKDGWFVRGYGSGEEGYHLAVDIMAPFGTPVQAAERGVVAYSGNGVRGYGNMVLLVHPGGWITMYAHNQNNFVQAGQIVERGDFIAAVGSSGISRGPHVHFEFAYHGKNCDPTPLFRPAARHPFG